MHKLNEEYTMIKFEDKYIHFRWDDSLKGKECFVGDEIKALERAFHENDKARIVNERSSVYPFQTAEGYCFPLCLLRPKL